VWNRTQEKVRDFVKKFPSDQFYASENFEDFLESLEKPRLIIVMVPAGPAVEEVLDQLKATLRKDDCVLEGGNSFFKDTEAAQEQFAGLGVHYLGTGISGGEEGALKGPSFMPGGDKEAWDYFTPFLEAIAATDFDGHACTAYMGSGGAGHYVKMVHNAIEYAEMQVLAEAYDFLKSIYELEQDEILEIFKNWQKGELSGFLLDTAVEVLAKKEDKKPLLDLILDKAAQKGTGRWTSEEALRLGVPAPSFTHAVFARAFSWEKEKRVSLAEHYPLPKPAPKMLVSQVAEHLEKALLASRIAHFEQGFAVLAAADREYGFGLKFKEIARVWQGGCIIRNVQLKNFAGVLEHSTSLYKGLWTEQILKKLHDSWKKIVILGTESSLPIPGFSAALTHFESLRQARSSANFIQGLRDRFGAHGYERTDKEGNFHSDWS
jgi:6-phosphogluconate dehydrogenase